MRNYKKLLLRWGEVAFFLIAMSTVSTSEINSECKLIHNFKKRTDFLFRFIINKFCKIEKIMFIMLL
ncbi:hypothetical protein BTO28_08235 [Domibacillus epiphyticus]|uniref:Uncharacterized protein n=1 Tax=Domibacillus epiphyticus TaxID=1714355 RepID=A0A1V2A8W6_9BACI|nr:hypothetical protein BTO28_08235 [Domibacillus epiphyticus]